MKLYALRDRLLEYFQRPFIGDTDATVLAAVAMAINSTETKVDFAQTPTHFEIWALAEIDEETGKVTPTPKFLSNCSDLRRGIRENGEHQTPAGARTAPQSGAGPSRDEDAPATHRRPPEGSVESQTSTSGKGGH